MSSRYQRNTRIAHRNVSDYADRLAWKRCGFKNRDDLKQTVRALPLEKQVEMLVEANIDDLAEMLFYEKQEFLLGLGHKTWVDAEEVYTYAKDTFKGPEWTIDKNNFHSVRIVNGTHSEYMNSLDVQIHREKREGKGKKAHE